MTPGTKLGPYEILSQIGAGGMGEVYRARDSKLGRDVAIKVLPEAFARDAERMARFQREAKVLASLDHPNIASIYGLEDSGGTRALVMQLVEGPTLADRIKAGPIPVDESVRIAKQIADALEYAHERGIIHRDLKPANVKVTNDDAVKVLDFGLAKALEGDLSSIDISTSPTISRMATMQGVLLGTAAYMSPEQAKAKTVDRRADIWAFGCVLYEVGGAFALSPDGRKLAFLAAGSDDVIRVWVRSFDSLEARPLADAGVPQGQPIFWSFDSRYIAFYARGKLKKIDVSGGPAQALCDVSGIVVGGSWNRDGVIIFGQEEGGLMRVSAEGGTASPLTILDSSRGDRQHIFPVFLPDGRHFIYKVTSSKPGRSGVYIGSLDVKPEQQDAKQLLATGLDAIYVSPLGSSQGQLLFVRDGTLVTQPFDANQLELTGEAIPVAEGIGFWRSYGLFSLSANGVLAYRGGRSRDYQLTWFDREGKVLGTAGEPGIYLTIALSPDGARAAVGRADHEALTSSVWLLDLSRSTSARFTFGPSGAAGGTWSPDGNQIVFDSSPSLGGVGDLYRKLASGVKDEEAVVKSNFGKFPTSWSHDGRFMLYTAWLEANRASLWVLPLAGEKKPFPFLRTDFNNFDGQFSPDGHWIAYVSDESGNDEIYVRTISPDSEITASDTGGKWLISNAGGSQPRWRGDGKELYYLASDGKLMAVEIAASPSFRAGVPKALFQTPTRVGFAAIMRQWDVVSDGRRFLFSAPAARNDPFTVVLNWQAALKK